MDKKLEDMLNQPVMDMLGAKLKKTQLGSPGTLKNLRSALETAQAELDRLMSERKATKTKDTSTDDSAQNDTAKQPKRLRLPKLHLKTPTSETPHEQDSSEA